MLRKGNSNVKPSSKSYREPTTKQKEKHFLYKTIQSLARTTFKKSIKYVTVKSRKHNKEYLYALKIVGFSNIILLNKFCKNLTEYTKHFKYSFYGLINPKTEREEIVLYLTIYNHNEELNDANETKITISKFSKTECDASISGKTKDRYCS